MTFTITVKFGEEAATIEIVGSDFGSVVVIEGNVYIYIDGVKVHIPGTFVKAMWGGEEMVCGYTYAEIV